MAYNIVEVDGVPAADGRLPTTTIIQDHTTSEQAGVTSEKRLLVDTGLTIPGGAGSPTFVSGPIWKTYHIFDSQPVTHTVDKINWTNFKTYTQYDGKYLREILINFSRKDLDMDFSINGITCCNLKLNESYDMLTPSMGGTSGDYFTVFKNTANNFTVKLMHDNTPIDGDITIDAIFTGVQTSANITLNNVIIVYNEAVTA